MLVLLNYTIDWLVNVYTILLLARALMSWFPLPSSLYSLYELLTVLTEPLLKPVRKLLWRIRSLNSIPVDISPIVLMFLLYLLKSLINALLYILLRGQL